MREWIAAVGSGESPEDLVLLLRAESLLRRLPAGGEISITHDTSREGSRGWRLQAHPHETGQA